MGMIGDLKLFVYPPSTSTTTTMPYVVIVEHRIPACAHFSLWQCMSVLGDGRAY